MKSLLKYSLLTILFVGYCFALNASYFSLESGKVSVDHEVSVSGSNDVVIGVHFSHADHFLVYSFASFKDYGKESPSFFATLFSTEPFKEPLASESYHSNDELLSEQRSNLLFPFHTFW